MKNLLRITYLLFFICKVTASGAQVNGSVVNMGTNLGKSIMGGLKDKKKQKNIQASVSDVQINGRAITVLRVPEEKIISPAKTYIVTIQQQLEEYSNKYKEGRHINIPAYNDDIAVLKNVDADWPTDYYQKEMNAYREFEQELVKTETRIADSIAANKRMLQKKLADSLALVQQLYKDSVAYASRVNGFHFVNRQHLAVMDNTGEKGKSMGRLLVGSYVRVTGYTEGSPFVKIQFGNTEGFVDRAALAETLDAINVAGADLAMYKKAHYNKFEPDYAYQAPAETETIDEEEAEAPVKHHKSTVTKTAPAKRIPVKQQRYITGPRGGCYYLTASGEKVYVDKSLCR